MFYLSFRKKFFCRACFYLEFIDYNDYGMYTKYFLRYVDDRFLSHALGEVRIGRCDLLGTTKKQNYLEETFPEGFEMLPDGFFSVGQSEEYYRNFLRIFGMKDRKKILSSLLDCAFNLDIFQRFKGEEVMYLSVCRFISERRLQRFNRLSHESTFGSKYSYQYKISSSTIDFSVDPECQFPTNIHAVIGSNGVGKTTFLKYIAITEANKLLSRCEGAVSNVVFISFSLFDSMRMIFDKKFAEIIHFTGLIDQSDFTRVKNMNQLYYEFYSSFNRCLSGSNAVLLYKLLDLISVEFCRELLDSFSVKDQVFDVNRSDLRGFFNGLSSGQATVVLVLVRLVDLVEEGSIVLFDEPESHLHPALLSKFIRCLASIAKERNATMILSTHSLVVLQEVPKSCVWIFRRPGGDIVFSRPSIQTFGESIDMLMQDVFSSDVSNSGYFQFLTKFIDEHKIPYLEWDTFFGDDIGSEAKLLLRNLLATRS